MQMSVYAYQQAGLILNYIEKNPGKHVHEIAAEVGMISGTTHTVFKKMVQAEVLSVTSSKIRGGRRYFYHATGKALPERIATTQPQAAVAALTIAPVHVAEHNKLPSFLRALTPLQTS